MKNLLFFSLLTAAILTGCAGMNQAQPPVAYEVKQQPAPKSLSITLKDPFGSKKFSERDVMRHVVSAMAENSRFHKKKKFRSEHVSDVRGRTIVFRDDVIRLMYVNGDDNCERSKCPSGEGLTKVIFEYPYSIETKGEAYLVKVGYPNKYTHIGHTSALGILHKPLAPLGELEKDSKQILEKLDASKIRDFSDTKITGSFDVKFPTASVKANYDRLLKQPSRTVESDNGVQYYMTYKDKRYEPYIKVSPYRNGSKVDYTIYATYKLFADGSSELYPKDKAKLKKMIEKIAND